MDQYDKAVIKAQKLQDKRIRYQPLHAGSVSRITEEPEVIGTLHLPKVKPPKTPTKRTNEIGMTVYVDGEEIQLIARLNLNDIIASQRNKPGLSSLLKAALSTKFGKVDIQ